MLPTAAVTDDKSERVEAELSAADVERAFVSCQGGDEGAETISFCLAICGRVKFEAALRSRTTLCCPPAGCCVLEPPPFAHPLGVAFSNHPPLPTRLALHLS